MTPQHTPAGPASHAIIPADPSDTGTLSQVIADAFFPLAPCRWLVPDEAERRQILPLYFRLYVEHALAGGLVRTTPDRTAVALWLPAGPEPQAPPDGYAGRLAGITGPWLGRFQVLDGEFGRHHPAGTPHHYLAILAVRPDRQGQGTGTALLEAHHAALDTDGIPAYLEAADQRSRRLYLTCGYTDHGSPIQLPGGPQMHPMLRPPSRASQATPPPAEHPHHWPHPGQASNRADRQPRHAETRKRRNEHVNPGRVDKTLLADDLDRARGAPSQHTTTS